MRDIKRPFGIGMLVIGAIAMLVGVALPTFLAPERNFEIGRFQPVHIILLVVGLLAGITGLVSLMSRSAD